MICSHSIRLQDAFALMALTLFWGCSQHEVNKVESSPPVNFAFLYKLPKTDIKSDDAKLASANCQRALARETREFMVLYDMRHELLGPQRYLMYYNGASSDDNEIVVVGYDAIKKSVNGRWFLRKLQG